MSQSRSHFYHEAINGCYTINDYRLKVKGCGDSTTAFTALINEIKFKKTVVIKKNKTQLQRCIDWCHSEYGVDIKSSLMEMNGQLSKIKGLVVNQSDINGRLKDIWEYLVDDEWNDKYSELKKLNIQVDDTSINERAALSFYDSIQQNN